MLQNQPIVLKSLDQLGFLRISYCGVAYVCTLLRIVAYCALCNDYYIYNICVCYIIYIIYTAVHLLCTDAL